MFCKNCGKKLDDGSKFCSGCGANTNVNAGQQNNVTQPINQPVQMQQSMIQQNSAQNYSVAGEQKSMFTTLLLALFLGSYGGHYFYLGKTTKGIICVLFSLSFIPYILSIIDIVRITRGKLENLNAYYNVNFVDMEQSNKKIFLILTIVLIVGGIIVGLIFGISAILLEGIAGSDMYY